jgi:phosphatidylglycerophosphate synthase
MAQRFTLDEIRARTYKRRDAWWTVWLVDPLAARLVWLISPWRWVTPNRITTVAFLVGVGAAAAFHQGAYGWLALGALLFHLSFVLDCIDGKIARLNGTGSVFGVWLDYVFDRLRVLVCTLALFGGQYQRTHEFRYVWLAGLVIFLDMFRYLNALQMSKVKADMKLRLAEAHPAAETEDEDEMAGIHDAFRQRFGRFARVRDALVRQRIRPHLFSGIEFMMAVFIVGPLVHRIVGTTLIAAALLTAFELLLISKLYAATRSFTRLATAATAGPSPRRR